MKRKVARIGPSTLMVSLPSKWCKENSISPGEELEVDPSGNHILVSRGETKLASKDIELNLTQFHHYPRHLVATAYKCGYDSIKARYSTLAERKDIEDLLGYTCFGYSIIEESPSYLLIKDIAQIGGGEFETVLKKCFFQANEIIKSALDFTRTGQGKYLTELLVQRRNLHKYTDLARRLINKKQADTRYPSQVFLVINQLELVTKSYQELCLYLMSKKLPRQQFFQRDIFDYQSKKAKVLSPKLGEMAEEVSQIVFQFGKLFFSPRLDQIDELIKKESELAEKMKQLSSTISAEEAFVFANLWTILTAIRLPRTSLLSQIM